MSVTMKKCDDPIKAAHKLNTKVEALHDRIDQLLEPVCVEIMQQLANANGDDQATIQKRIDSLPPGFHRSELRTAYIARFNR